jgi:hypothetical protein
MPIRFTTTNKSIGETKMENSQIVKHCAEAAHEMNRIYCEAHGDMSQPAWKDAPEWQRSSAINGVAGALAGNTPEQSHESWLTEKAATGWKYGPVKNPETKEHPCFVPYTQLPPEQQQKDHLFLNTVRAMATALKWSSTG